MIVMVFGMVIVTMAAYLLNGKDVLSPAFLFAFSFLFSSCWGLIYSSNWSLYPGFNTILVIILGTLEFIIVAKGTSLIMEQLEKRKKKYNFSWIKIKHWKILIIILIEVFTIFYTIKTLRSITGLSSLSDAIYSYRRIGLFTTQSVAFPKALSILRKFSFACNLFFSYLFVKGLVVEKKINWLIFVEISLSIYDSSLTGARTDILVIVIAIVSYYYCLKKESKQWILESNWKIVLWGAVGTAGFLSVFKESAKLLGRNISSSSLDYLAEYLGAEIKNLDSFLKEGNFPITVDIYHSQSLIYLSQFFGKFFGASNLKYKLDLPFRSINNYDLGNVYTTFYQYLYDLGYMGVFIFVLIMAFLCQFTYEKVKSHHDIGMVPISTLTYGYMASALVLSFFSNKFYEQFATPSFIYIVVFWILLNWFMLKSDSDRMRLEKG